MSRQHHYKLTTKWQGNKGTGTSHYTAYDRSHTVLVENKAEIHCSADPAFRGDLTKHNPEDLLVASLSSCHMLWYLHLCADEGIVVTDYIDNATGILLLSAGGEGRFTEVTLNPMVTLSNEAMIEQALALHHKAHECCFIANSVNFPITIHPVCNVLAKP